MARPGGRGQGGGGGGLPAGHRFSFVLLFLLLFFATTALGRSSILDGANNNNNNVATTKLRRFIKYNNVEWGPRTTEARRQLIGPGSSPPTCRGRCGRCYPCRPVHVAIQPGLSFPLEYYPEAWRCKCGNKLYMP